MVVDIENRHEKRREQSNKLDSIVAVFFSFISLFLIIGRLFLFTPYQVSGLSMSPTLGDGDRVVVTEEESYKQGDIIVFESPVDKGVDYVKRVVGTEGDLVSINEGIVTVNGEEVYNQEEFGKTDSFREEKKFDTLVPKGHLFVLGDNRENSMDSRIFGTISTDLVKGKMFCRLSPLKDFKCDL